MKKIFSTLLILVAGMAAYAQEATLSVDDMKVVPGKEGEVVINVTGASNYIAAGMYITLPDGFEFVYNDDEESYCVPGDVLAKSHSVADNLQEKNALKFAITSLKNASFKSDEGTLASAAFKCPEDAQIGSKLEGAIKVIEFSKANGAGLFTLDDVTFGIEVTDAVAIESLNANDTNISEVYSVSGAQQNNLQKGVNIVKYANGEVKKVVVK